MIRLHTSHLLGRLTLTLALLIASLASPTLNISSLLTNCDPWLCSALVAPRPLLAKGHQHLVAISHFTVLFGQQKSDSPNGESDRYIPTSQTLALNQPSPTHASTAAHEECACASAQVSTSV